VRAVVQRVARATVYVRDVPPSADASTVHVRDVPPSADASTAAVDGVATGAIERGLLVYLGVGRGDGERERTWMLDKILGLRIFPNDAGKMDKSVLDVSGKLLVVSQFTLYGDVRRGRRPSFDGAMPPAEAEREYELFVAAARERIGVETGRFAAHMLVDSVNDGPVTIWLDTSAG
jgi:D-tyrosyl-tRNA(Tyr) deacylase